VTTVASPAAQALTKVVSDLTTGSSAPRRTTPTPATRCNTPSPSPTTAPSRSRHWSGQDRRL